MVSPRALVVTASMGAGHITAGRVLADGLGARGATVETIDFLDLPRLRQGHLVRGFYRQLIRRAPAAYGVVMRLWARHRGFFEWVTAAGAGSYERALLEQVARVQPDVVVSTYNLAGQALGRLRQDGRLPVPAASYVTDPGAHPYWVAPGVDRHLAPLARTAEDLRSLGAREVRVVAPLVEQPDGGRPDPAAARRRWELPTQARVALVNGGSWGVGAAADSAAALLGGGVTPVVLCGRSRPLLARICALPGAVAVGWTDAVPDLLAACDVVVDNAGGTTCWEALAAGRPVVVHAPIPGHGRLNAATLAAAGLVTVTWSDRQLQEAVRRAEPAAGAAAVFAATPAADEVAALW